MGKRSKVCSSTNETLKVNKQEKNKKIKLAENDEAEEPKAKPIKLCTTSSRIENMKRKNGKANAKNNSLEKNGNKLQDNVACEGSKSLHPNLSQSPDNLKVKNKKNKVKRSKDNQVKNEGPSEGSIGVEDSEPKNSPPHANNLIKKKNKFLANNTTTNDDEPVEDKNESNNKNKTKSAEVSQEDEVRDEDIDKFCAEINDEDNVQFENWVELIEAKLNSNKKKSK